MRAWAEGLDFRPDDGETAKVGTVYLITFARLLRAADVSFELRNPTTLTRQDILDAVLDALENPIRNRFATGRPREQKYPNQYLATKAFRPFLSTEGGFFEARVNVRSLVTRLTNARPILSPSHPEFQCCCLLMTCP